jgi:urease accessory protein
MFQASKLLPQGQGLAPALLKRAATVELDWDVRQKSRFDAVDSQGRALGVFLPRGTAMCWWQKTAHSSRCRPHLKPC